MFFPHNFFDFFQKKFLVFVAVIYLNSFNTKIVADTPLDITQLTHLLTSHRGHNQLTSISELLISLCFSMFIMPCTWDFPSFGLALNLLYLFYF